MLIAALAFGVPLAEAQSAPPCALCPSTVVVWQTFRDGSWEIAAARPDGSEFINLTSHYANDEGPAVSPDGRAIAFSSDRTGNYDLYVMDFDGANLRPVGTTIAQAFTPVWSPDGTMLAFSGFDSASGNWDIYTIRLDGSHLRRVTIDPGADRSPHWSPDGTTIAFHRTGADGTTDIFLVSLLTLAEVRLTSGQGVNAYPAWSPDGRSIAFASTRSGPFEWDLYIMDSAGAHAVNVTNDPDSIEAHPRWSPDGQHLVFERFPDPTVNVGEVYHVRLDGSDLANVSNHPGDDRSPHWGLLALPETNTASQALRIELRYQDNGWGEAAPPSATGAAYWIEGTLRTPLSTSLSLGRIADERTAFGLAPGVHQLFLTYGPARVRLFDRPFEVLIEAGRTATLPVDLSRVAGVLAGVVTVNQAAPGDSLALCVVMGSRLDLSLLQWCQPLESHGTFEMLLPAGDGIAMVCLARAATDTECSPVTLSEASSRIPTVTQDPILATFPFKVDAGSTTIVPVIDVGTPALEVSLRYQDDGWAEAVPPSATGAAYWIEGTLRTPLSTSLSLGRIADDQSVFGLSPGAHRLFLTYGPGRVRLFDRPFDVLIEAGRTAALSVDLSRVVGVLAGAVTVNQAVPGDALALCVIMGTHSDLSLLQWCQPIESHGTFKMLLPAGDGIATVCLTSAATDTECSPVTFREASSRFPTVTQNPILATFPFRVDAGSTTTVPVIDVGTPALEVRLRYQDHGWAEAARPSATGAAYWIEGTLRTPLSTSLSLGRIADDRIVFGLATGAHQLFLTYGPARVRLFDRPFDVLIEDGRTTTLPVDLTPVAGVLAGAVTVNQEAPGDGLALCVVMGSHVDLSLLQWCQPLESHGTFRMLLPTGDGVATVCLASAATDTECSPVTFRDITSRFPAATQNPILATFRFTVEAGTTTIVTNRVP